MNDIEDIHVKDFKAAAQRVSEALMSDSDWITKRQYIGMVLNGLVNNPFRIQYKASEDHEAECRNIAEAMCEKVNSIKRLDTRYTAEAEQIKALALPSVITETE